MTTPELRPDPPEPPDLFAPDVDDPYPLYQGLRDRPAWYDARLGAWLLPCHAEVVAALRDTRLGCPVPPLPDPLPPALVEVEAELRALHHFRCLTVLPRTGVGHAHLRRLMQPAFAPRAMARLRPRVQQLVDGLLDRVQNDGRMDVMADLAVPLPTAVVAVVLGVPPRDVEPFSAWCTAAFYGWPDAAETPDPAGTVRDAYRALRSLCAYLAALAEARQREPRDDLVSVFAAAVSRGELSQAELAANAGFLCESGRGTTTHLIGNAVAALLQHPAELERLRRDPALIGRAVEEFLRYDPPTMTVDRVALASFDLCGHAVRAGETVMPLIGAANRDPARYAEPERLDLNRPPATHVAFGGGPHVCPGAPLARLELEVVVGTLVRRCSGLRPDGPQAWRAHPSFRLLSSLPVAFSC